MSSVPRLRSIRGGASAPRDRPDAPARSATAARPRLGVGAATGADEDATADDERTGDGSRARAATADAAAPAERRGPAGAEGAAPDLDAAFRAHARYVAGVALRVLGRDDDVDDVVQEVFLAALKGLAGLRDPAQARSWLATVTVRCARRRLAVRRVRGFFGLDLAPDYERVAAPGASPEERALLGRVYAILDELPVADRLAWTLRHVEGDRLETVAERCGCSLATAKRRIAAAHAAIERRIGP